MVERKARVGRFKIWPGRIFVVGLGLAAGLVLAELGLRVFFPQHDCLRFAQPDLEIGWVLKANYAGTCIERGRLSVTEIVINAMSIRGPELEIPKPEGRYRVLFLGDSMTFGSGVAYPQSFPMVFEGLAQAQETGADIEAINAGVPGYGTGQELLFFERIVEALDPDLVVLAFFPTNDLQDNGCLVYNPTRPCFRVVDSGSNLVLDPPDRAAIESYGPAEENKPPFELHLGILFRTRWNSFIEKQPALLRIFEQMGGQKPASSLIESWYSPDQYAIGWPVTVGLLDRFAEITANAEIPFIVVVLPDVAQVSGDHTQIFLDIYQGTEAGRRFEENVLLPQQLIVDWGKRAGVAVIDPAAGFSEKVNAEALYIPDQHLSLAGHALVAGLLFKEISARGLIPVNP